MAAQTTQALTSLLLLLIAARMLDIKEFGAFSVLYGGLVLGAALTSGFVGDTLTVLDRTLPDIRAALVRWMAILTLGAAVVGGTLVGVTGFADVDTSLMFAAALAAYLLEDILRRVLGASLSFYRVAALDAVALVGSLGSLALIASLLPLGIGGFLASIACGQSVAAIAGVLLLPREERRLGVGRAAWGTVAAYGVWRAAQQMLRPLQLTGVRIALTAMMGLAAAGELELARVYAAPCMLLVMGVCSYLFPAMARQREQPMAELLATTDRRVGLLLVVTALAALLALAALPALAALILGRQPSVLAVSGWLVYAAAVATATPYGHLAAIRGRPRGVFLLRAGDTVLSVLLAVITVQVTGDFHWVPWACAAGAVSGAIAIRLGLLPPSSRTASDHDPAGSVSATGRDHVPAHAGHRPGRASRSTSTPHEGQQGHVTQS